MNGALAVRLARTAADGTRVTECRQTPPWKLVRSFTLADGAALLHLQNVSGGLLAGDDLEFSVHVEAGASAQFTTTGATRIYRARGDAAPARVQSRATVQTGALLEYLPDALIPFAGARAEMQTRIELEPGAKLLWWDWVAPGREARGESFAYEHLTMDFELRAGARPVAIERARLSPGERDLASAAALGPFCYFGSFYICEEGRAAASWQELEQQLIAVAEGLPGGPAVRWGITKLAAHGLLVRGLATASRHLHAGLVRFWKQARPFLCGHEAIEPRRTY